MFYQTTLRRFPWLWTKQTWDSTVLQCSSIHDTPKFIIFQWQLSNHDTTDYLIKQSSVFMVNLQVNEYFYLFSQYEKQFTPMGLEPEYYDRLWDVIMARLSDPAASSTHQTCLSAVRILRCGDSENADRVWLRLLIREREREISLTVDFNRSTCFILVFIYLFFIFFLSLLRYCAG